MDDKYDVVKDVARDIFNIAVLHAKDSLYYFNYHEATKCMKSISNFMEDMYDYIEHRGRYTSQVVKSYNILTGNQTLTIPIRLYKGKTENVTDYDFSFIVNKANNTNCYYGKLCVLEAFRERDSDKWVVHNNAEDSFIELDSYIECIKRNNFNKTIQVDLGMTIVANWNPYSSIDELIPVIKRSGLLPNNSSYAYHVLGNNEELGKFIAGIDQLGFLSEKIDYYNKILEPIGITFNKLYESFMCKLIELWFRELINFKCCDAKYIYSTFYLMTDWHYVGDFMWNFFNEDYYRTLAE